MYAQQLPDYNTAFKNAPWEKQESEHYKFHYVKGSIAEKEIDKIVTTQENAFRQILAFLNLIPPGKKIFYYLYPDASTKEQLMGSSWFAQSVYSEFEIHALYTEESRVIGPHEDTHLLSLPLGLSIGFLQEGLAEQMVGHDWYGNSFKKTVREALSNTNFHISPHLLTNHQAWVETNDEYARQYYSLAALFSDYLINIYGKDKYLNLYTSLERGVSSRKNEAQYAIILHSDSTKIFQSFLAEISTM